MSLNDQALPDAASANKRDHSSTVLIGANLIPLVGVLVWDWNILDVVALYWLENVIIGVINILKMLTCAPDTSRINLTKKIQQRIADRPEELGDKERLQLDQLGTMLNSGGGLLAILNHGSKLLLIPFFIFHYGLFCFVHGIFIFTILGNTDRSDGWLSEKPGLDTFFRLIEEAMSSGGVWAALALAASHLFSFGYNYLGKGEFRRSATPLLMIIPYGRITVLHIAILFGAFAIEALGSPIFLLLLLIGGKTLLDLMLHLRAHRKLLPAAFDNLKN